MLVNVLRAMPSQTKFHCENFKTNIYLVMNLKRTCTNTPIEHVKQSFAATHYFLQGNVLMGNFILFLWCLCTSLQLSKLFINHCRAADFAAITSLEYLDFHLRICTLTNQCLILQSFLVFDHLIYRSCTFCALHTSLTTHFSFATTLLANFVLRTSLFH